MGTREVFFRELNSEKNSDVPAMEFILGGDDVINALVASKMQRSFRRKISRTASRWRDRMRSSRFL